jgi:DNA topoisomerase-1
MNLVIVESPAKAKTIEKYLGKDFRVVASVGHVRDLIPENGSVDPDKNFDMKWQIMPGKEKQIKLIMDEVKKAGTIYIASDPDREGEAIAWHIYTLLNDKKALAGKNVHRVAFHEITKKAVQAAIDHPREIDQNLVDAYLVRRALDYLIGFNLSPVLWRKNLGRSAGRVQSVAVALVVAREREIELFKGQEYWSLDASCVKEAAKPFLARLTGFNGKKIEKMTVGDKAGMDEIIAVLAKDFAAGEPLVPEIPASVAALEKKKTSRRPAAPFTTSTLQQEAARKLHFSAKRTSSAAQKLYEAGYVTYIRTDSTNLAADAVTSIRDFIGGKYGDRFLPKSANIYATKAKNAQEAHEAIRPTDIKNEFIDADADQKKLYDLIWKRTVACQMTNAEFDQIIVDIKPDSVDATFHAVGTTRTFDGFLTVYAEGRDDEEDDAGDTKLPPLSVGDKINISELLLEQHFTSPPPRYTEASLIKKLEELGIGRPSTYAGIMSTIVDRDYVNLEKQRFFATTAGWLVTAFLEKYFREFVAVEFTANTEDALDNISNGDAKKLPALHRFWDIFNPLVDTAKKAANPDVMAEINTLLKSHLFPDGNTKCPECGNGDLELKVSRYGAFLGCSNYPECKYTKNLSEITDQNKQEPGTGNQESPANSARDLGDGLSFKTGRFGPYVTDGKKNVSAKPYTADTITLEIAQELLRTGGKADPINLGKNPATGKEILFYPTGRFGPYISSNKVNVSVKEQPSLEDAAELINNKKPSAKRTFKKKK